MVELKSYALKTDQGPHLNLNEDLAEVDLMNNLFLLIDGFGGSNIGDRTAMFVRDSIKRLYTKISIDPDSTLPFYYSPKYLIEGNALVNAFYTVHNNVIKENEHKNMDQRGGASIVAASLAENILTFVGTGNCSAYLYRKGRITSEILPDSLANVSRDDYKSHLQTIPMSGIGLFEDLHLSVREIKIAEGDVVLMMSDGVFARLTEEEIKYSIEKYLGDHALLIKELFKFANDRGNLDNQSAIALQF